MNTSTNTNRFTLIVIVFLLSKTKNSFESKFTIRNSEFLFSITINSICEISETRRWVKKINLSCILKQEEDITFYVITHINVGDSFVMTNSCKIGFYSWLFSRLLLLAFYLIDEIVCILWLYSRWTQNFLQILIVV